MIIVVAGIIYYHFNLYSVVNDFYDKLALSAQHIFMLIIPIITFQ